MVLKRIVFIWCLFCSVALSAQGEIDYELKKFYNNERTLAFHIRTNGWGFDYRYAKRVTAFKKRPYQVAFHKIKHPREFHNSTLGVRFVHGKMYSFFTFSGSTGIQKERFSKFDRNSVAIRTVFLYGASLGLSKPVYYKVKADSIGNNSVRIVPYSSANIHGGYIDDASFFVGLNETKLSPGVNANYSVEFEFSSTDKLVRAVVVGAGVEVFPMKIQILDNVGADYFFASASLSFRFGKIIGRK